jgi:ABC-type transport system involved in cytochrome c biogenesis permease component
MTFLPVVERELRVGARKASTYWTRVSYSLFAIVLSAVFYLYMQQVPFISPARVGTGLFHTLGWLCYLFALVLGIRLTANSITDEKREGTLGLLFLTDLKGYDVALGKLAACSLTSGYALLGVVPILAIAILLGGTEIVDLAKTALSIGLGLGLALSIGLFCSTVSGRGLVASALAFFLILGCLLGPILYPLWKVSEQLRAGTRPKMDVPLASLSPGYALAASLEGTRSPNGTRGYWTANAVAIGEILFFFFAASKLLPRVWQDHPRESTKLSLASLPKRLLEGNEPGKTEYRHRLLETNAFLWRSARNRFTPHIAAAVLILAGGFLAMQVRLRPQEWRDPVLLGILSFCVHSVVKLWAAGAAVRSIAEDRRTNALELMLTTPLTIGNVCNGQIRFLVRQFGGIVGFILLGDLLLCSLALQDLYDQRESALLLYVGRGVLLPLDLMAIGYLSLWVGTISPHLNQAVGMVGTRILLLPWAVLAALLAVSVWHTQGPGSLTTGRMVLLYLLVSLANSVLWTLYARKHLERNLRTIASEPVSPKPAFWQGLLLLGTRYRATQNEK